MAHKLTLKERILRQIAITPGLSDGELTELLCGTGKRPQPVNTVCRDLESQRLIARRKRIDGKKGNFPTSVAADPRPDPVGLQTPADALQEENIKRVLKRWLESNGWDVQVAWGGSHGVDIAARRGKDLWLIEVKGRGSRSAMRVNYFLAMLGEILQRMSDSAAFYSIALPDLEQYRRLWDRLPALAKERTRITELFVSDRGNVTGFRPPA